MSSDRQQPDEPEARAKPDVGRHPLAFLAEASRVLASSLDFQTTLANVARLAVPTLADWCIIDLADENGQIRQLAVAHTDPAKVELAWQLDSRYPDNPNAPVGVPRVIRTGTSELYPEITDELLTQIARDPEHLRTVRQLGLRSGLIVPLWARDRTLGAMSFGMAESGRRYDSSDVDLAEELARRGAIAIDNARLYREVREADRRKDEFLAMLAHELRNPLAPIRNALQVLRLRGAADETALWAQDVIGRQTEHMARLVNDLLDVSRITRGKIQLQKERVDLRAVAERALENARPFLDAPGHQVEVEWPPDAAWVEGDATRLEQVLTNLLHNAAKYTEPGGRVWLWLDLQGSEARLRVRDTGIGMREELLPRVFDLFVQSDRALDRAQGGLGIGLTLVRSLVEMHGGTVRAFSAGLGMGSEFVIRLPLVTPPSGAEPVPAELPPPSSRCLRVLVVDDNEDAATSLAVLLRIWGHEATVAHEGRAALLQAAEVRPDAILLDIGLPGMDGYQIALMLKEMTGLEKVLLVALTGYGQDDDRRRSREVGFHHHLVKPIDPQELRELLARV